MAPGQTLACEVEPDQETRLERVALVRRAAVAGREVLPGGRLLITLKKAQGETDE